MTTSYIPIYSVRLRAMCKDNPLCSLPILLRAQIIIQGSSGTMVQLPLMVWLMSHHEPAPTYR